MGRAFDILKNHRFWVFDIFLKKTIMFQIFEKQKIKNQRTASSRYLKNQNQRKPTIDSNSFPKPQRTTRFHEITNGFRDGYLIFSKFENHGWTPFFLSFFLFYCFTLDGSLTLEKNPFKIQTNP